MDKSRPSWEKRWVSMCRQDEKGLKPKGPLGNADWRTRSLPESASNCCVSGLAARNSQSEL